MPSTSEIENSFEYKDETPPYLVSSLFDRDVMTAIMSELLPFSCEFAPPLEGNPDSCDQFFWENNQFSYSDAMAYYCFIRRYKPQTVLEVGSGFSTLIAAAAIEKNGTGRIVCIEPYPRPFIKNIKGLELIQQPAQKLTLEFFRNNLTTDDILFIDSTHTVKTGSDCLHIYLRILPLIEKSIIVHAHDIYLPFGMPKDWLLTHHIFWTEQYLLLALLIDNPRTKLLFSSTYNKVFISEILKEFMHNRYQPGGGSIWFSYGATNDTR